MPTEAVDFNTGIITNIQRGMFGYMANDVPSPHHINKGILSKQISDSSTTNDVLINHKLINSMSKEKPVESTVVESGSVEQAWTMTTSSSPGSIILCSTISYETITITTGGMAW